MTEVPGIVTLESNQESFNFPELSFAVRKKNHRGRIQPRTLRLTNSHIENVKKDIIVTKRFPYSEISGLKLQDTENFVISYTTDHDFHYMSPVAPQIVLEISQRLNQRLQEQNEHEEERLASVDMKAGLPTPMTPSIPSLDTIGFSQSKSHFSIVSMADPSLNIDISTEAPLRDSETTSKLAQLTGKSETERVVMEVRELMLKPNSPEAATLVSFMEQLPEINTSKRARKVAKKVRQFTNWFVDYIVENHGYTLLDMSFDLDEVGLRKIVEVTVLSFVLVDIYPAMFTHLSQEFIDQEEKLRYVQSKLLHEHSAYFGVPPECITEANFSGPIRLVAGIDPVRSPPHIVANLLIKSARLVQQEISAKDPSFLLTGDTYLPIHSYVLVRSQLSYCFTLIEMVYLLLNPRERKGRSGYYVTVFSTAVHYLEHMYEELKESEANQTLTGSEDENFDEVNLEDIVRS
ncbi:hypothetical protein PCE1_000543 [Barthelona sp. PCE]